MKISKIFTKSLIRLFSTLIVAGLCIPFPALAASTKPTCRVIVSTPTSEVSIKNKSKIGVYVLSGDTINIAWESKNAETAKNSDGDEILLSGAENISPIENTTYSYTFVSDNNKKVTCGFKTNVVDLEVDESSLSTTNSKPTISGNATGTKSVQIVVRKEDSTKIVYKSKVTKVKNGEWDVKIAKKLADGRYGIEIFGANKVAKNSILKDTLVVGSDQEENNSSNSSNKKSNSTLSVQSIPLLFGGTARANSSVPVSYLQITNTGKETVSLNGFWVKQNGSANTESIIGLTTVDDKGASRGSNMKTNSQSLFKNGSAFAPVEINTTFAPGQMRLFTVKAVLASDVSSYIGEQIVISVTSVDANGTEKGAFPIAGTTWTIGY